MVRTDEFVLVRFDGDQAKADAVYAGVAEPLVAEDVADAITWVATRPSHVSIDELDVLASGGRREGDALDGLSHALGRPGFARSAERCHDDPFAGDVEDPPAADVARIRVGFVTD
jgi:hypothetical protein